MREDRCAKSPSDESDQLFLLATERFCAADTHDRLTIDQYREAFDALILHVSANTRQIAARQIAHCPFAPRHAVMLLALEPVEVSGSILQHSPVLGQLDLMRIVGMSDEAHAAMVAKRPDIGPSLLARLREIDSETVTRAIAENEALIDTEERSADELFREIDSRPAIAAEPRAVESTATAGKAQADLLRAVARTAAPAEERRINTPTDLGETLEKLAAAKARQAIATLMSDTSGMSLEAAFMALEDKSGDALAVFLKANGVAEDRANRILMLTLPTIGLSVQNASRAIEFYAKLTQDSCAAAVAQWPRRGVGKAQHQPVYEAGTGRDRVDGRAVTPHVVERPAAQPMEDLLKAG